MTLAQVDALFPGESAGPDILTLKTEADFLRYMSQFPS